MAFNGSGTFVRLYNWATDAANAINISATRMDGEDSGFASGLSNCVTRDGQSPFLANIPAGGFKITGLGNGTLAGDAVAYGQITGFALLSGSTFIGRVVTLASATGAAGFNVPAGVAPTSPVDGDLWSTTTAFYARVNGVTKQFATLAGTEALTNKTVDNTNTVLNTATPVANAIGSACAVQNNITASYTLAIGDFTKAIYISGTTAAQTLTIPANASVAFPTQSWATITNDSNQAWSIAITSDTLFWSPSAGTGTRTLAAGGKATIEKVSATRWWIYGTGLT